MPKTCVDVYTGVYWGAFDPPTEAHRAIIEAALDAPWLHDLIVVVNNHSYKNYTHGLRQRCQLMQNILGTRARLLVQDDMGPLDHRTLMRFSVKPLCAIAGYDSYMQWENGASYPAIAVVPRGLEKPMLRHAHAFLLTIDACYRDVSSTKVRHA